jgi:amino acid transporter
VEDQSRHLSQSDIDAQQLAKFGYKQELNRALNTFSHFALPFSHISPTIGIFTVFGFVLASAGPAVFWTWPLIWILVLLVGLSMAEMGSHYPIAGGTYQWTKHLAGERWSWFQGWIYLFGQVASFVAIDFGLAIYFAGQVGMSGSYANLFLIALVVMVGQLLVVIFGVRLMAMANNIGVITEILALVVLGVALLIFGHPHSLGYLFNRGTWHETSGYSSYGRAYLVGMLMAAWTFYGFETAGDVAEEAREPEKSVPRMILLSLVVAFVTGGIALLGYLLAIGNIKDVLNADVPLEFIIRDRLGSVAGSFFIWSALVAMFACGLAVLVAASRSLFSYTRDNRLPGSRFLAHVSPRWKTPANATTVIVVISVGLMAWGRVEERFAAGGTVLVYFSFIFVIVAMMYARFKGWKPQKDRFNLGRLGPAINVIAIVYAALMIINLVWPPNQWAIEVTAVIAAVGVVVYFAYEAKREKAGLQVVEEARVTPGPGEDLIE